MLYHIIYGNPIRFIQDKECLYQCLAGFVRKFIYMFHEIFDYVLFQIRKKNR